MTLSQESGKEQYPSTMHSTVKKKREEKKATPVSIRHFGTGPAAVRRCRGPPWHVPLAAPRRLSVEKSPTVFGK